MGNTHSKALKNVEFLPVFHRLCQEFGVRPTYLVSWSVASDKVCSSILENLLSSGDCEVGIHPHLWETPPFIKQDSSNNAWVGLDYTSEVLEAKLTTLTDFITKRFGRPTSHRAGRWGIDARQVNMLLSLGIRVDSSIIPGIDWSDTGILDHTYAPLKPYYLGTENIFEAGNGELLEVPCTKKHGVKLIGWEKNR